jgi:hypothetical protein
MAETALEAAVSDEEFYTREFTERPVDLDCPEHGVNLWILGRARRLWQRNYSDREIIDLLYKATRRVRHRSVGRDEIVRAVEKVVGTALPERKKGEATEEKVVYDPSYLQQKADAITDLIDTDYLEARSQFTCWNRTPVGFLHKLYQPGEHIWITDRYKSLQGEIWTHDGLDQRFDELDHFLTGHDGVWYLTAPVDGRLHQTERVASEWNPEGLSFTVLESLAAWRYLLIETDVAPIDLWRKAVVQWPFKIVAIYESGGSSDHVIIRIDAQSKDEFERKAKQFDRDLVRLGACEGSITVRRLSRLPNCMRGQTGRPQRLLYLSPDADGTPICQIPPREPHGSIEARIRATHAGALHNYETPAL